MAKEIEPERTATAWTWIWRKNANKISAHFKRNGRKGVREIYLVNMETNRRHRQIVLAILQVFAWDKIIRETNNKKDKHVNAINLFFSL
jgi:hypothetical protein